MLQQLSHHLISQLHASADSFETPLFLQGDPSWFMHQVSGQKNQETMAFVASCLSYGSRKQFLPKIEQIRQWSKGDPYLWVSSGAFGQDVPDDDVCFYRLYTRHKLFAFLSALRSLFNEYGSLGDFVLSMKDTHEASQLTDVEQTLYALSDYFWQRGITGIVPRPGSSLCKRPVMFLRWMVRSQSPVDLGLWDDILDRRHLLIPMDTHVMQTARRLGLLEGKSANWNTVKRLSALMAQAFPDDPARGDFALYGADLQQQT